MVGVRRGNVKLLLCGRFFTYRESDDRCGKYGKKVLAALFELERLVEPEFGKALFFKHFGGCLYHLVRRDAFFKIFQYVHEILLLTYRNSFVNSIIFFLYLV